MRKVRFPLGQREDVKIKQMRDLLHRHSQKLREDYEPNLYFQKMITEAAKVCEFIYALRDKVKPYYEQPGEETLTDLRLFGTEVFQKLQEFWLNYGAFIKAKYIKALIPSEDPATNELRFKLEKLSATMENTTEKLAFLQGGYHDELMGQNGIFTAIFDTKNPPYNLQAAWDNGKKYVIGKWI